eukprot:CAMPEP_0184723272 /NCGR_PEP_ID=MMETSP0314-20130426/24662_1 /TAXON_ID=38298 /ORGANISM="Rhodella maculata, Strain CCMP 736" /LENGTH=76 /DNA_ID=CAMNT_0027188049 /DNA_START=58 /DNA_END=285 /DNA_ORIENTATION=-
MAKAFLAVRRVLLRGVLRAVEAEHAVLDAAEVALVRGGPNLRPLAGLHPLQQAPARQQIRHDVYVALVLGGANKPR